MRSKEVIAALSVLVGIVAVPCLVGWYHNGYVLGAYPEQTRVITLYAVAERGVWTLEKVNGSNYWWKDFKPATLYLNEGENVVLRLESTDVHHRFYCPELNIGPIEVEAGHVVTAEFQAHKAGTYRYYCTSMCGDCHFYMQGWIVVTAQGQSPQRPEDPALTCDHANESPPEEDMLAWGQYLYQTKGCTTCHGEQGQGGIENPNYIKEVIPAHDTLADKLWLKEKEHAELFIDLLKARVDFNDLDEQPDIPLLTLVRKQYTAAKDLIKQGKHCAKMDVNGPEPPLHMISWEAVLSDRDIDAIIAYLISLYDWDESEE